LRRWFAGSPGRFLVSQELACVEQLLPGLFGYYLVQVGDLGSLTDSLKLSPIRRHLLVDAVAAGASPVLQILAEPPRLPLATDAIDAVLLPHTLDFSADPHQVLREAERVLIPEGRVIILGFNPWSLWGIWRIVRRFKSEVGIPWCGQFLTLRRVQDWLSLLGFDLEVTRYLMFSPPLKGPGLMGRLDFMETAGPRWWPMFGGVYLIQAVKRVSTLTPIEPRWKKARSNILGAGAIEPTARNSNGDGFC
jgi:SAM-dependent methyltransferase